MQLICPKLEWVQAAVQLIAPILHLMTEKWATEQSCIHIEITSCKRPTLVKPPETNHHYVCIKTKV